MKNEIKTIQRHPHRPSPPSMDFSDGDTFDAAASYVERLTLSEEAEPLPDAVLLDLYALFKQVTVGPCASSSQQTSRPGIFDLRGRKKYDAWSKLGDLTTREAQRRYADTLTACRPRWRAEVGDDGDDGNGGASEPVAKPNKPKSGVGPVFSVLKDGADEDDDEDFPPIIRLVQGGTADELDLIVLLRGDPEAVHHRDSEGCTALHWAADKGNKEMTRVLLDNGADKHATDVDGLTPLEYALAAVQLDRSFFVENLS